MSNRFDYFSTSVSMMYASTISSCEVYSGRMTTFADQWKCAYCGTVTKWHMDEDVPRPKKCHACGCPREMGS